MTDVLVALREATAASHARIENLLRLDGEFSLEHYRQVIRGFDAFLTAWEPMVAAKLSPGVQSWFAQRTRGSMIVRDLQALGLARAETAIVDIALPSQAAAFGSMYVLEGSALGGQVICKRLSSALHIGPDDGGAYFAGWGSRTGAMWKEFREVLSNKVTSSSDIDEACTAANQTFDSLCATFEAMGFAATANAP